jgi:hypothetical protein
VWYQERGWNLNAEGCGEVNDEGWGIWDFRFQDFRFQRKEMGR